MKKRSLDSCDSLGALISICPSTDPTEEEEEEESGVVREKKRRLSVEQVKALEKHFEVENKLEPERKTKMAEELGLQPRQVAVWFQNRRARWKTKQLEKDYSILKSSFDSLHHQFLSLQQENESLNQKVRELKSELNEEEEKTEMGIKEEEEEEATTTKVMGSESDSSAVLNSPNSTSNDDGSLINQQQVMMMQAGPSITYFNLSEVKMEEHDFLGEEGCNFFPEDQAPSLHWYCTPDPDPDHQWAT